MTQAPFYDDDGENDKDDHDQVDCDGEGQREEREEREMILTTVQLRRASIMDTLVPQVAVTPIQSHRSQFVSESVLGYLKDG